MELLLVPVSPGELLDKITILRIKSERIPDAHQLANVRRELALLEQTWRAAHVTDAQLAAEEAALLRVNGELWDIEDRIREHEAQRRFRRRVHRTRALGLPVAMTSAPRSRSASISRSMRRSSRKSRTSPTVEAAPCTPPRSTGTSRTPSPRSADRRADDAFHRLMSGIGHDRGRSFAVTVYCSCALGTRRSAGWLMRQL